MGDFPFYVPQFLINSGVSFNIREKILFYKGKMASNTKSSKETNFIQRSKRQWDLAHEILTHRKIILLKCHV